MTDEATPTEPDKNAPATDRQGSAESSSAVPVPQPPSGGLAIRRGAIKRCPACGQGKLFRRWFVMVERCPRCGLHFERIEGHWVGAVGINTVVSFAIMLVVLVISMILTFPDFPVVELIAINVAVAALVPAWFYPFSKTLWTGIDLAMRPLEADEVDWTKLQPDQGRARSTDGLAQGRAPSTDESG